MRINIRYEERKVRMEERIESLLQFLPYRNQPVMHGKKREKLRLLAEAKSDPETEKPADIRADAPWYVGTDLEWYMSTYKENYYRGIELRGIIQKFPHQDLIVA